MPATAPIGLNRQLLMQLSKFIRTLRLRFDKSPIDKLELLIEFIHTRAAYVAQTSLYGYLKTRMGRQYVKIFKDDRFSPSLTVSKWAVYTACLSDLATYAVATISGQVSMSRMQAQELGQYCLTSCVEATYKGQYAESIMAAALQSLLDRNQQTIWANAAIGDVAFTRSPETLADSSPVSAEFQELDRHIVMNSVRFRWINVREEYQRRIDSQAVWQDWMKKPQEVLAPANKPLMETGHGSAQSHRSLDDDCANEGTN